MDILAFGHLSTEIEKNYYTDKKLFFDSFYRQQWKIMTNCRTCRRSQSLPDVRATERISAQSTSTSATCASSSLPRLLSRNTILTMMMTWLVCCATGFNCFVKDTRCVSGSINQRWFKPCGQGGNPCNTEHQGDDLRRHLWVSSQGAHRDGHPESSGQRNCAAEERDGLWRQHAHDHRAGQWQQCPVHWPWRWWWRPRHRALPHSGRLLLFDLQWWKYQPHIFYIEVWF